MSPIKPIKATFYWPIPVTREQAGDFTTKVPDLSILANGSRLPEMPNPWKTLLATLILAAWGRHNPRIYLSLFFVLSRVPVKQAAFETKGKRSRGTFFQTKHGLIRIAPIS